MLTVMVLGATPECRQLIDDMSDGNVERIERDERAKEASQWLRMMQPARVC
jgi:hypothetical protein